jgi:hypothetical protein
MRYVAKLVGAETDSERAIRWPIALMVWCCDPLAIALMAAGFDARQPLPKTTFWSVAPSTATRGDAFEG